MIDAHVARLTVAIARLPDQRVQRCLWRCLVRATLARQAAAQDRQGTAYLHRLRICRQLQRVQASSALPRPGSSILVPIPHRCLAAADPLAWAIRDLMCEPRS